MANGNSSPGVSENIVSKMMDNLTDLSNNVGNQAQSVYSLKTEMSQLTGFVTKIAEKLATPPRHEEIYQEILNNKDAVINKFDKVSADLTSVSTGQINFISALKSVIKEVRIYLAAVVLSIIIAGGAFTIVNYMGQKPTVNEESSSNKKQDAVIKDLKQQIDELRKLHVPPAVVQPVK